MAASCDAPANTMTENPTATAPPRPWVTGVAPATRPKGTTPTSIGATARAPARRSDRTVDVDIARSCPARRLLSKAVVRIGGPGRQSQGRSAPPLPPGNGGAEDAAN